MSAAVAATAARLEGRRRAAQDESIEAFGRIRGEPHAHEAAEREAAERDLLEVELVEQRQQVGAEVVDRCRAGRRPASRHARAGRSERARSAPADAAQLRLPHLEASCRASFPSTRTERPRGPSNAVVQRHGLSAQASACRRESAIDQLAGRPERGRRVERGRELVRAESSITRGSATSSSRRSMPRSAACTLSSPTSACAAARPIRSREREATPPRQRQARPHGRCSRSHPRRERPRAPRARCAPPPRRPLRSSRALVSASHSACQAPGCALVLLHERAREHADAGRGRGGRRRPRARADGVALVRHRRRAARPARLGDLADLGLREQRDVERRSCRARRRRASAAPSSAMRTRFVCQGSDGSREPELVARRRRQPPARRRRTPRACRRRRRAARRAARERRVEPAPRVEQRDEPTRRLEPERRRHGLLKQRAAGHRRRRGARRRAPRSGCDARRASSSDQPSARAGDEHRRACRGCPGSSRRSAPSRRALADACRAARGPAARRDSLPPARLARSASDVELDRRQHARRCSPPRRPG